LRLIFVARLEEVKPGRLPGIACGAPAAGDGAAAPAALERAKPDFGPAFQPGRDVGIFNTLRERA
jgi:hypothetical protein